MEQPLSRPTSLGEGANTIEPIQHPSIDRAAGAGRVHQINVSPGGVPKLPVPEAEVMLQGLAGDRQRNRRIHGGPRRALCLYSLEVIDLLRAEGHPIAPGTAGENITISGVDWSDLRPGARILDPA